MSLSPLRLQLPVQKSLIAVADALHVGTELDLPAFVKPQNLAAHLAQLLERVDLDRGRTAERTIRAC